MSVSYRFTRLGDGNDKGLLTNDGVAVTELVGKFDLDRDPAPVLDCVLGHVPGIGSRAAGNDNDLVDPLEDRFFDTKLIEHEGTGFAHAAKRKLYRTAVG